MEIDPDAELDFVFDWDDWLSTDTIASYELVAEAGVTVTSESNTDTQVVAWVTVAASASLTCRVTTAAGRIQDRTVAFEVVEQ